jgi:hypothetical protein
LKTQHPLFRLWSCVLIVFVALSGCVSVDIHRSKLGEPHAAVGSIQVAIYENDTDFEKNLVTSRRIVSELKRVDVAPDVTIYRGADPQYERESLAPGRYSVTAIGYLDAADKEVPFQVNDHETFRLRAGENVRVSVLVKAKPKAAINGMGAALIAGIALAVALSATAFVDQEPSVAPERITPAPSRPKVPIESARR